MATITTKRQLVKTLAEMSGVTQVGTEAVLDALSEYATAHLRMNGIAMLHGIGKLRLSRRQEREGFRPTDGEKVIFPAKNVVKFSCSSTLRRAVQ